MVAEYEDLLRPYADELRSIFIVSDVTIVNASSADEFYRHSDIEGITIKVASSGAQKCERCWVHDPAVGNDSEHPNVCGRCLTVLKQMDEL